MPPEVCKTVCWKGAARTVTQSWSGWRRTNLVASSHKTSSVTGSLAPSRGGAIPGWSHTCLLVPKHRRVCGYNRKAHGKQEN